MATQNRAAIYFIVYDVYCSSTSHYEARVVLERGTKKARVGYDFNGGLWFAKSRNPRTCPAYLEKLILEDLRLLYKDGLLRFYECNQDGERRYENLRYHHEPHFEHLIGLQPTEASE